MPVQSIGEARDAICAFFKAAWEAGVPAAGRPVVYYDDDQNDQAPPGTPYVRFSVKHANNGQATLANDVGSRRFRRQGFATAQVFTVLGEGLKNADAYSKVIVDAFEGASTGADAIIFRSVTAREVGRSSSWWQTNVVIEFEYDSVK